MPIDFDSYGLDDDTKAKLKVDYETDINGLKAKNSDLIEREKAAKAAADESLLAATKAEEDAKVALAEKSGDIEKYKLAVEQSREKMDSMQLEFKQKETQRLSDMAANDFISKHVSSDPAARSYMESIYRNSIDVVDGVIKPKDITKTLEDLQKGLVSDEAYSKYIKADVGSGAGANGSVSVNGSAKSLKEMNATEKAAFANAQPDQYALMTKQ